MQHDHPNTEIRAPRARRARWLGLALLCPMLAAAAAGLSGGGDESAAREAPPAAEEGAAAAAEEAAPRKVEQVEPVSLEIRRLRVGAPPFAWTGKGDATRLASFITDSDRHCTVIGWARLRGAPPEAIRWEVTPPAGFALPSGPLSSGPALRVTLARPGGNPKGGGGPLAITVRAYVERDGRTWEARQTITQDERDVMRQEYVDLKRERVPERHRFLDAAEYGERYGRRFPQIRFEELNWSLNPDTGERFRYILISERLLEGLARTRAHYGRPLVFTSGYRNPTRQVEVHAPVRESLHQYGLAADLAVLPNVAEPRDGRATPSPEDWLCFAEAATAAGASWVEPLAESGGHLHVDFRDGGSRSGRVTLKGRVLDAESGEPIAGARVLLGGMPATTNAAGRFLLRHILTPREREVAVTAEGYQPLSQAVPIRIGGNPIDFQLQSGPRPRLAARAVGSAWQNERAGLAVAELRIRNTGEREARSLFLVAAAAPGAPAPVAVAPKHLAALPTGSEASVRLTFKVTPADRPDPASVVLRVTGADPEGVARNQRIVTRWTPPERTPHRESPVATPRPAHAAVGAGALGAAVVGATTLVRRRGAKSAAPARESPSGETEAARRPEGPPADPVSPSPVGAPPVGEAAPAMEEPEAGGE